MSGPLTSLSLSIYTLCWWSAHTWNDQLQATWALHVGLASSTYSCAGHILWASLRRQAASPGGSAYSGNNEAAPVQKRSITGSSPFSDINELVLGSCRRCLGLLSTHGGCHAVSVIVSRSAAAAAHEARPGTQLNKLEAAFSCSVLEVVQRTCSDCGQGMNLFSVMSSRGEQHSCEA